MLLMQAIKQQRLVVAHLGRRQRENRRQMRLRVDRTALVHLPVEVDRETRNHRQWRSEIDQRMAHTGRRRIADTSGKGQVTVEPGIEQCATVDLDAKLQEAASAQLRARFGLQAGAVGVRADQADSCFHCRYGPFAKAISEEPLRRRK
jgi:hypothetical protein